MLQIIIKKTETYLKSSQIGVRISLVTNVLVKIQDNFQKLFVGSFLFYSILVRTEYVESWLTVNFSVQVNLFISLKEGDVKQKLSNSNFIIN